MAKKPVKEGPEIPDFVYRVYHAKDDYFTTVEDISELEIEMDDPSDVVYVYEFTGKTKLVLQAPTLEPI